MTSHLILAAAGAVAALSASAVQATTRPDFGLPGAKAQLRTKAGKRRATHAFVPWVTDFGR